MSYEKYAKYNRQLRSKISATEIQSAAQGCILTSFIYALAEIESEFGFFWGHGESSKTPEQQLYAERYSILRKKILDNGNNQIRKFNNIIDKNLKENRNGI